MRNFLLLVIVALFFSGCGEGNPRFERMPSSVTGITFTNTITPKDSFNVLYNEYIYNGGGVGVGDFNGDGLQDLLFSGNQVSSRLYLNKGNFQFEDITHRITGLTNEQWFSGVTVADVNGDGLPDFYLTSTNAKAPSLRKNQLWIHQGMDEEGYPRFEEQAEKWGIADMGYSVHAAFFDYDLDGDLDLYVLNNVLNKEIPTNYRNKIVDGTGLNNDRFYRNEGNGAFTDITVAAGIVFEGYGLGIAVGDVNKDGYPDLYISNDYVANDLLYLNQGDGTFRNLADSLLSYSSKFSMGNDMADLNGDGFPEIMTLDMMPELHSRKKQTINGNSYNFYVNDAKYGYQHQYVRNMLHLHNGFHGKQMLPYSEIGQMMGVFQTEWSWSPLYADYDNDGDRDLLLTNGFPKDLTDKDFTNYKAQMHGYLVSDADLLEMIPIVKVPNYAYEQTAPLVFEKRTAEWGFDIPSFSNGAVFVDLDNDGDLDYVVNNIDDEAFVYQNHTRNRKSDQANFLRLNLLGTGPNTQAIGSKVELWAGGQYQFYEHFLARGYISTVDPVAHFGLGTAAVIDSLRVIWPDGQTASFLTNLTANQLLTVRMADAKPYRPVVQEAPVMFQAASGLLNYRHQDEDFIDFYENQRIIPHKFSQTGPAFAKGDLNGDGLADLIVGATNSQLTRVYLRTSTGFEAASFPGLTEQKACLEADLLVFDVDGDGDQDVIAISGGYSNPQLRAYRHYWYENKGNTFEQHELPIPPFVGSVVRAADFDNDGDLDLFVGARVQKGGFPLSAQSHILRNEGGTFTPLLDGGFDLGMITDAVWSDTDGDGFPDLLLAREWNSLAVLKNKKGAAFELEKNAEMEKRRGLWSGLAAVDIDGDGDDDYIAGNLGLNHRFEISAKYPMRVYAVDIDRNEDIDPISTAYWRNDDGEMEEYLIHFLDELASQSPFFRKTFTSYASFSRSAVPKVFQAGQLANGPVFAVNTTESFLLRNEKGNLVWEPLPMLAQVSPITRMLVRDFNADGLPDVLLGGNDHSYDVSTGLYDAHRGLILLGSKKPGPLPLLRPAESGIVFTGQVGGLLFFEENEPMLVAGFNRRQAVVFRYGLKPPQS